MATGSYYFLTSDNVAPNATPSVETGAAITGYEPIYLTDFSDLNRQRPAMIGTTGALLLDWGAAQRIDFVVMWHNADAALANVKIQHNAANTWGGGGPTVSTTVVPPAKLGDGSTVRIFKDLRGVSGYSASGFRYMRFPFTTANSANIGLKVLCFSSVRALTAKIRPGLLQPKHRPVITHPTDFGHEWTYDLAVGYRDFVGDLFANSTDRAALTFWHDACGGAAKLTTLIPEPDDPTQGAIVGHFLADGSGLTESRMDLTRTYPGLSAMQIRLRDTTAGGPEWT